MRILIIDSHKGTSKPPQNLHWLNAYKIKCYLDSCGHPTDIIWSYPTVNDEIRSGYDVIIFNHASHYSYVDYNWIVQNPSARLYYITNEYNLGEPRILWMAAKNGATYKVIANHDHSISKVVGKYVSKWNIININSLIFESSGIAQGTCTERQGCVYYGSFRKDRSSSFKKYLLDGLVTISTHKKNRDKFGSLGITGPFINRINWDQGLSEYKASLYIEDDITHSNYNYPANRFYEALNYNVVPLFDSDCVNTLKLSEYNNLLNNELFIIDNIDDLKSRLMSINEVHYDILDQCKIVAETEKNTTLKSVLDIISE